MLVDAISLLLAQLNQYIHQTEGDPPGTVDVAICGNIAQLEHPDVSNDLENQLVLTLVKVEEEHALRNGHTFIREPSGAVHYHNPPLHLNLFLLFSANYRNYQTALKRLAQVMTFFQGKTNFTPSNSPGQGGTTAPVDELSLTLDLLSLSFDEVNHLWGSLGGKQLPFVVYKGRLVTLRALRILDGGGYIHEIDVTSSNASL